MNKTVLPAHYTPCLGLYDTQKAIGLIKQSFEIKLCSALHLKQTKLQLMGQKIGHIFH